MRNYAIDFIALTGSYGISFFSFLHEINAVGIFTGLAGGVLTFALSYKEYQNAKFKQEERRKIRLQNDKIACENKTVRRKINTNAKDK